MRTDSNTYQALQWMQKFTGMTRDEILAKALADVTRPFVNDSGVPDWRKCVVHNADGTDEEGYTLLGNDRSYCGWDYMVVWKDRQMVLCPSEHVEVMK